MLLEVLLGVLGVFITVNRFGYDITGQFAHSLKFDVVYPHFLARYESMTELHAVALQDMSG